MSLTALWTLGGQLLRIGKVMDVLITGCFTAFYQCLLEPYEVKVSRTVLR